MLAIWAARGGKTMMNGIQARSFNAWVIWGSRSGRKDATIMTMTGARTTMISEAPVASWL